MSRSIRFVRFIALISALLVVAACGTSTAPGSSGAPAAQPAKSEPASQSAKSEPAKPDKLEPVTLHLNHIGWGMHTPYFVALEKGFYREEGLDLKIVPGKGAEEAITLVASGKEEFGIALADSFLAAVAKGVPIKVIAMDQQESPSAIFALKESGIKAPKDLEGRTLAQPPATSMRHVIPIALRKAGVDVDKVKFVDAPAGSEVQLMLAGKIDSSVGFSMGQPMTLKEQNREAVVFTMKDFGIDLYGTMLITNDKVLKERPQIVEKFLRGTLKGLIWQYQNVQAANDILLKHRPERTKIEADKSKIIFETYKVDEVKQNGWGFMSDARWQKTVDVLVQGKVLEKPLEVKNLYTNEFLAKLPEAKQYAQMLFAGPPKD